MKPKYPPACRISHRPPLLGYPGLQLPFSASPGELYSHLVGKSHSLLPPLHLIKRKKQHMDAKTGFILSPLLEERPRRLPLARYQSQRQEDVVSGADASNACLRRETDVDEGMTGQLGRNPIGSRKANDMVLGPIPDQAIASCLVATAEAAVGILGHKPPTEDVSSVSAGMHRTKSLSLKKMKNLRLLIMEKWNS